MVEPDDAAGVLLGLACGDALGRPVEGRSPAWIADHYGTVTDMLGNGVHGRPPGTVTDDTELALRIARSLAENSGFDGGDIADRFHAWYADDPVGVGRLTADTIRAYGSGTPWRDAGREVWYHRPEGDNAGNGSVMRCAPHAVALADDPGALADVSGLSSAITHYDPRCRYGCAVLNCTIAGYLRGESQPLARALERVEGDAPTELVETLRLVPGVVDGDRLGTSPYVVETLQTALYDALTADSAEDAVVTAVNRGGDADTIGAVAGAVAGARFGAGALPDRWLDPLEHRAELELLARALATTDVDPP